MEKIIKELDELKIRQKEDRAELTILRSVNENLQNRIETLEENFAETLEIAHFVNGSKLTDFNVLGKLGKPKASKVFKVRSYISQRIYAIKKIERLGKPNSFLQVVERLSELDHKHVVRYYGGWTEQPLAKDDTDESDQITSTPPIQQTSQVYYIQMKCYSRNTLVEAIEFGGLNDILRRKRLFREIVSGLIYIHEQNMVHCNLTLDKVLLDYSDHVKISGLDSKKSIILRDESSLEFPQPSDHKKVDIYFLGLIYFTMCYTPIQTKKKLTKFCNESSARVFELPDDSSRYLFPEDIRLVEKLLHPERKERPNAKEVLKLIENCFKMKENTQNSKKQSQKFL